MLRILLSIASLLAACTSSPQKAAMPSPVSAPNTLADSPAEARGRRILSTAFVRIGPDGQLTVESSDGRVRVLRDVIMRPKDYCGVQIAGGSARGKYCGGYAEVAAARPGGGAVLDQAVSAASDRAEPARGPIKGK